MRRETCNSSKSLKPAGAVRSELSRKSVTSAVLRGGPRGGAGENHVVHARGAHVLVRAFAHHPAQRFDEIGLAAAIGADDTGQAGLDHELGRFDEGFEAKNAQPIEFHRRAPSAGRARSRPATRVERLQMALDDGRHLVNRQRPRIFVAVDEESRRGIHPEIFLPARTHGPDIIQKLLVGQAGLEGLL